jgi:ATP-binding cassette subfamily C (CFTR/MRP) protein 1
VFSAHIVAYFGICFGVFIALLATRSLALMSVAVQSARKIHKSAFNAVVAAPVPTFFDIHSTGEIVNRLAKDTETVDSSLPDFMMQFLMNAIQIVATVALCVWVTPWFSILLPFLFLAVDWLHGHSIDASRDLKRLECASRSPIYASLGETLAGLSTIRAFGHSKRFFEEQLTRIEANHAQFYHQWMVICWMTARMEIGSAAAIFALVLLVVLLNEEGGGAVNAVAVGLAVSYCLQITGLVQRTLQVSG